MSKRFLVHLTYDGTDFHGSQYQPGLRTVQGEVERALRKHHWQGESVLFAGRTDAGVHAEGQIITFDLAWEHTEKELSRALNAVLPQDISAVKVEKTRSDFHPRYDALAREYHYQILSRPHRDPLRERYTWRVWPELNIQLMKKVSSCLIGSHDFAAFGNPHETGGSTVRNIFHTAWKKKGDLFTFEIVGNAFLYHMVRRIVMALINVGQEKVPISKVQEYLDNPSGPPAQGLAPAKGLVLKAVRYK